MARIDETIISKTEALADQVLTEEGLELVEVQYRREGRGWVLRLFIDRPLPADDAADGRPVGSGVTLDDCTFVNRELGRLLDVEEVVPGRYTLEVSSPGLNRPLKKEADFLRFAGRLVKIKVVNEDGRKQLKGRLLGLRDQLILLETDSGQVEVPYEEARNVRLVPEVQWAKGI